MWENMFSRGFSSTQPNTLKYFSKHFLGCDQTLENIFIFWKILYTLKSFYIEPNTNCRKEISAIIYGIWYDIDIDYRIYIFSYII